MVLASILAGVSIRRPAVKASTRTLSGRFRRPQNDRFIQTAQVQFLLGKGNLEFRFPETPVNLQVNVTSYLQPVIRIQYPDAKLKVECALTEILKCGTYFRLFLCTPSLAYMIVSLLAYFVVQNLAYYVLQSYF